MSYFYIAVGGALGSVARFWLASAMAVATGSEFPWGTLLINMLGSFVISFFGLLTGRFERFAVPYEARVFVTVGLCGGFTTFSSFSLQTLELARTGQPGRAGLYVFASVAACLAACGCGFSAPRRWVARSAGSPINAGFFLQCCVVPPSTEPFVSFPQQELCKAEMAPLSSGLFTAMACRLPNRYHKRRDSGLVLVFWRVVVHCLGIC